MIIKLAVNYTEDEIDTMIQTLNFLSDIIDNSDEGARTIDLIQWSSDAFENLAKILCLDPKGEEAFHKDGW